MAKTESRPQCDPMTLDDVICDLEDIVYMLDMGELQDMPDCNIKEWCRLDALMRVVRRDIKRIMDRAIT